MANSPSFERITRLIAVPALISLGITLLRLVGEIFRWPPTFFSREAGGAGAIVGIVWLVPIFGIYFAIRLNGEGNGPASCGRAIGYAFAGLAVFVALTAATFKLASPLTRVLAINLASVFGGLVVSRGWPGLAKTELAYGVAARVPVAAVMLIAMIAQWGTHYELGPPRLSGHGSRRHLVLDRLLAADVFLDWIHGHDWLAVWEHGTALCRIEASRSGGKPQKEGSEFLGLDSKAVQLRSSSKIDPPIRDGRCGKTVVAQIVHRQEFPTALSLQNRNFACRAH